MRWWRRRTRFVVSWPAAPYVELLTGDTLETPRVIPSNALRKLLLYTMVAVLLTSMIRMMIPFNVEGIGTHDVISLILFRVPRE